MQQEIRQKLHEWYEIHKRDLPWRNTSDPYVIWLSEIILQQTRIDQGLPYFIKFSEKFPTILELASAREDKVMKLWQGLGYYSRARNLLRAAKQVIHEFSGVFPSRYDDLLKLKGVGDYTASAISSFSAGEARAVVDGNVIRVISRIFGIQEPVDAAKTLQLIKLLANELLDKRDPGTHNQSIMDFGALQCVPRKPDCAKCPLAELCIARSKSKVAEIPLKSKKVNIRNRYFHYFVPQFRDSTLIEKRSEGDIWTGLFQFPLVEKSSDNQLDTVEIEALLKCKIQGRVEVSILQKHVLTHQHIHTKFYRFKCHSINAKNYQWVKWSELHRFALPRLIERFLKEKTYYPLD